MLSVLDIKENPINPRFIEEEDYEKLLESIREFPNMLQLRPIVIDLENIVVGGNQRLRACKELGLEKVPTMQVTKEMLSEVNEVRKLANKPEITYEQLCKEFVIKDNVSSGQWDWNIIETEFAELDLEGFGFDVEFEMDDSFLQDTDLGDQIARLRNGVRKAIQIEFDPEHYEEAKELVKHYRDNGANIGLMLIEILKKNKK